jgi:hypothetical protein
MVSAAGRVEGTPPPKNEYRINRTSCHPLIRRRSVHDMGKQDYLKGKLPEKSAAVVG